MLKTKTPNVITTREFCDLFVASVTITAQEFEKRFPTLSEVRPLDWWVKLTAINQMGVIAGCCEDWQGYDNRHTLKLDSKSGFGGVSVAEDLSADLEFANEELIDECEIYVSPLWCDMSLNELKRLDAIVSEIYS